MSAFLGKIHYWLFNKIERHEKLVKKVVSLSKTKGFDGESLLEESYSMFGAPTDGPLEDQIEHSNIHGWLQERIVSVESNLAYVVTKLLENNIVSKEELSHVFFEDGVSAFKELSLNHYSADVLYNSIFDYMLEGMPCDRVNEIIQRDENIVQWKRATDIHKKYWDEVGGNVQNFYDLRDMWIRGFIDSAKLGYQYTRTEDGINTIKSRK